MFFLALRHLLSRKKQTTLTLIGILLGTAAYISITAMMMGFQSFLVDQLVNNDSHIRIKAREEVLTGESLKSSFFDEGALIHWIRPPSGRRDDAFILAPGAWLERLENDEMVVGASPQLVVQGIATYGKVAMGVSLVGSEPERQKSVSNIEKSMVQGKFSDIGTSGNRIAVGDEFLKKIGATRGETIFVTVGRERPQPFRIVSVFHIGIKTIDEIRIFGALADMQKLNQTPSRVSDIAIRLADVTKASDVAKNYDLIGQESVQSWEQSNEGILSVFKTQDIVRNTMTISILIVAGFGIYNILSLAVTHKRREIAILRSMGFEPTDITNLFLIQGIILGLLGGTLGAALGFGASHIMASIEISANRGLGGNHMMILFDPIIYVKAFGLALASSCFASYFPARSAGRLEPIDIIRSENS
ncbi:MAG: ABC transporter permease [Bdellovibrionaceae bacterium]|nr:ABC transporter permease [Pseudobdellovibrionaceae bacterium]